MLQEYFAEIRDPRQQVKVKHKLLEIVVKTICAIIPQLLNMPDISGCIVTADVMSCQKKIVKKVVEKQADYVLSLKENQPTFCHEVQAYFSEAVKKPKEYPAIQQVKTLDSGHGRIEKRT